ncbi:MAG: DUF2341 domain-containing protein [Patescibacteria group bacterium]|nr:DUF2341 domain-containing protein [Patescibacteria group bacterium]
MPRVKKIIKSPLFKLGFLTLFIILSFGYLRHNFSAKASDEQIKLSPQSFSLESNAADLNNPAIKSDSIWQNPEKALTVEADQAADFSAFNDNNSAVLIFGSGSLPTGILDNKAKLATSSAANGSTEPTMATGTATEIFLGSSPVPPSPVPADQGSSPVLVNDGAIQEPVDSGGSSSGDGGLPAAPALDSSAGQNHLPEAGPAAGENDSSQPAGDPALTLPDNSAESAPIDSAPGGSDNNSVPVPTGIDQGANGGGADSGPVSLIFNLKSTARAIGQFWHNLISAPKALAENAIDAATSSPELNNSKAAVEPAELKDSLIFSDFNLDSYSAASEITNVQLRLSLAAASTFTFDHLLVEYSTGGDWQTAGDLFLKGGVANAANGGYFLYALPVFNSWDDINNLRVRISYQNSEISAADLSAKAAKIYLDGLWLEVDYNQGQVKAAEEKTEDQLGVPGAEEHFFNDAPLTTDGQKIDFAYSDAVDDENLIIKTDRQNYSGLNGALVYFSVTNQGEQTENFGLQTYFPAADGNMTGLEKLSRRAMTVKNPTRGDRIYYCSAGWQATSSTEQATSSVEQATSSAEQEANSAKIATSSGQIYFCPGKNNSRQCDSLSPDQKKCRQNQVIVGSSGAMENVDQWNAAEIIAGKLPDQRNLWQKIFGLGPRKKSVPENFVPRSSTAAGQFSIQPGETEYFKMNISFTFGSQGEFYLETVGDKSGYGLLDPWWNASWNYEVPVSVTYAGGNTLTDFQVPVTIDTATLIAAGKMNSDCSDIAFADSNRYSDTSELYYFLEPNTCNRSYTKVWVKIPLITGNKTIYLYYGNSAAASYSSGANTFVYFNDFETSNDFTSGSLSLARIGGIAAKYGSLGLESNTAGVKHLGTRPSINSGRNLIWETWTMSQSSSTLGALPGIEVGHPTGGGELIGYTVFTDTRGTGGTYYLTIRKDFDGAQVIANSNTYTVVANTWYFLQFTWRSTGLLQASLYAGATTTPYLSTCTTTNTSYTDGEYGVAANQFGTWDNYRVRKYASSTVAAALGSETLITNHVPANPYPLQQYPLSTSTPITNGAWTLQSTVNLQATSTDKDSDPLVVYYQLIPSGSSYNTATTAPATFCKNNLAYSSCGNNIWANATTTSGWSSSATSYKYRQPIVVQSSQIGGALVNFPIYLDMARLGTANTFWSRTKRNSDGGDILITNSSGTRMPVEVVSLATSTKTGEVWFRADSISSSSNITFYLYYGSSTAAQVASTTTYGARAVWSNGYAAVFHYQNSSMKDSVGTWNGADNGTTNTTGKIGGARNFNGAAWINLGDLDLTPNMTLSAWNQPAAGNGNWAKIIGKMQPTHVAPFVIYTLSYDASANKLPQGEICSAATQYVAKDTTAPAAGTMYWAATTYDGSNLRAYYNGAQQGITARTGTIDTNNEPTNIGRAYYGGGGAETDYFTGIIDEVHLGATARTTKWLITEYRNQNSPGTFYSTSTPEQFYLTNNKKAVMIPGVPDSTSPAGYKWEAMACDSLGGCSNWAVFNSSIPNFLVDANAPIFSNTLNPVASTTASIKLSFPTAATEANFSQYKLYYRLGSTTPIHETDSLWGSSSDANLASRTFNGKSSTTVTGLATSTVYSFSLWAYDLVGHKSSTTLVWERTDRLPTVTFNSATEKSDGSGGVDLNFTANDPDLDDTLTARADYYLDANCRTTAYKARIDETDANTTAAHGDPKVLNSNSDQIGNSSGYITTSAGANAVNTFWLSKIDLPTATGTVCVKLIINDNRGGNHNVATTSVYIDNAAPLPPGSLTYSKKTGGTVTVAFGSAAHDNNFHQYKIFYKVGSSGVKETDFVFSSTSDINLGSVNYGGAATTTIGGLLGNTQYVFNIWAFDSYGNKASGTSEVVVTTNNAPAIAGSLEQYLADGSTAIANNTWINADEINLYATSTNPDGGLVTIYYQLATTSEPYLTATTTPVGACSSGAAYASCASRVWYSNHEIKADLKTIPDGNYKWQALACDSNGCARNWKQFNATVPNIKIDTAAPTVPGNLIFNSKSATNVKFNFGAPSSDPNFSQYKIFYKQGTSGVKETDSLWGSSSDASLGYINFNGKSSTTITGLTTGYTYVFNIFAYDTFGRKASASTEILVSLSEFPAQPFSLIQYKQSTSTVLTSGAWTTSNTVNLWATSTSATSFSLYYELLDNANTFTVATSVPATFCYSGTTFASCAGKIWTNNAITGGWYSKGYQYRTPIVVQSSQIAGALTNFPVYLDMARLGTTNDFWGHTKRNSDGGDIVITNSTGTRMPVEIVSLATSTYSGEVWFRADSISSSSNYTFYLYYGSSTASQPASSTTYGARSVWSNSYLAVYHLATDNFKDSTGNYNGTNVGTTNTTGKLGVAKNFSGTAQAINLADIDVTTGATYSAWATRGTLVNYAKIIAKTQTSAVAPYAIFNLGVDASANKLLHAEVDSGGTAYHAYSTTVLPTTFSYVAGTYDGLNLRAYYNGAVQGTTPHTGTIVTNNDPTQIGRSYFGGATTEYWTGIIDEARIASVARSGKWLLTEYNNQNSPGTFYSTSTEQYYLTPVNKAAMITLIPDSSYKWHALACNSGGCSPWAPYNLSTPNFRIDTIAPTAPGQLSLVSRKTTSITLGFGSPSYEANFSQYKIFYKQGTSGVKESDTLFGSSSDSSLGYLNYNGVPSITIDGLTANTQYVFNIWAYDQAGNKSSSTAVTFQTSNSLTEVYYYTSGATEGWINSPYAWDNTDDTYAYRNVPGSSADDSANYLQGTANNVATTTKSILDVELGLEGYNNDPNNISYKIIPLFSGLTAGNTYTLAGSLFGRTDSDTTFYDDITSDANAPAAWIWDDIINLDAKVYALNASSTVVTADVDQIRLRVTVDSYPDNAGSLYQYQSDKVTVITNGTYFNQKNIVLSGQATDPDPSETLSIYYQFIPTSQTFATSTAKPSGACASPDYSGCTSKIWVVTYSGAPQDFSVTPYIGTSSLTDIPDGAYKWQALVCDASDICSAWAGFNASTPNITIDTAAPATPGNLVFSSHTSGSINVHFGSATTDTNFYRYRIFYKKGSTSPVTESDSEQSDTNLNYINYNGAVTTTVAGLAKSSWYTFNIWAYDLAGNKASATVAMIASTTSGYLLAQTSYLIENDDGASVNLNTAPGLAGAPLANVEKGQRLNARVQIQNTGADQTYNKRFKLQYENNTDSPGIWTDVGAATPISYSYGISGANGDSITTNKAAANGNTWSDGFFQENTNLTNMYNLLSSHYTEFAFAVQTVNATVGKTYRLRLIDGTGSSTFDVYSAYPTLSLVANDTKRYSKDILSSLPVNSVNLTYFLDNPGYTAVSTDNNDRDSMTSGSGQYPIYNFAARDGKTTYALNVSWNGQSSVAPTANYVNLQVYRFGSVNAWTSVASNSSAALNTDFTLSGTIDYRISDYLSGGYVYYRVYQQAGAEILRSDYWSFTTSTPSSYVIGKHYRWRADDASAGTWREAEDTPDPTLGTAISKKTNIRLRLSFANTKAGTAANYGFGLQYATTTTNCSSGALSSWYQVRSTATSTYQFQIATSTQYSDASTTRAWLSTNGYAYATGRMVNGPSATSAAITLAEDQDTEVEFAIKATTNAKAGQTYCFRGTKNNVALDAYDRYAELTVAGTTNTAPSFTSVPSDGGSATSTPTAYGQNVNFSATSTDPQTDQYYLAICKTSAITAGNGGAPTCPGGSWCISSRASSSAAASCSASTSHLYSEYYDWYGFACDYHYGAGIAQCSAVSQGQAGSPNASTFRVNHPPSFSAVATLNDYKDPGSLIDIQATAADSDTDNSWSYYVCSTNGATAAGCTGGAGNTICSTTATTTANPICHYQNISPYPAGAYTYYAFVFDNFSLGATTSPRTSSYHINNTAPSLGALALNNNADITLNIKGAADKQVQLIDTSVTDLNGCQTLVSATGVIYRTALGYVCAANDNNCYQLTTSDCVKSDCSGPTDAIATYTCTANMKFFAEPTDNSTGNIWSTDTWSGRLQVYDGSNYMSTTSPTVEVNTNLALNVPEENIDFGRMDAGTDTGSVNQSVTVINNGNSPINSDVAGTDMTGLIVSTLDSTYIHWDLTQNFSYSSGSTLKNGGELVSLNLAKPTSNSDVSDLIYWGIGIPATSTRTSFHGSSTFAAILNGSGW